MDLKSFQSANLTYIEKDERGNKALLLRKQALVKYAKLVSF